MKSADVSLNQRKRKRDTDQGDIRAFFANQQQSTLNLYSHIQHPVLNVFLFAFILEIK